jgi:hypothetical protein
MAGLPREPGNHLDRAIIRVALERARKLIENGFLPEEAARYACRGSWSGFQSDVRARLSIEEADDQSPNTRSY